MSGEPSDLARFVKAQAGVFEIALHEWRAARKRTHWMWVVFPQLKGLGRAPTVALFGRSRLAEATSNRRRPPIVRREAVWAAPPSRAASLRARFRAPDDLKFRSSMALFGVALAGPYQSAREQWRDGEADRPTGERLRQTEKGAAA